jgi:hypothetical protein
LLHDILFFYYHYYCCCCCCYSVLVIISCHSPFLPGASRLEQVLIPSTQASSFRLQYFLYHVRCSKHSCLLVVNLFSVFLVWLPDFSLKLLLLIICFMFHICCISIHKLLCFSFFSASFCVTFLSAGIVMSNSVHGLSFLFSIIISGLFATTSLSVSTPLFHKSHLHVHICFDA